ncbi:MAG: hypothetical protein CL920_12470 [Deltaproteobacteria bacterium]|nr:hypothetical protein [Deltaproteobacteria bacterium]|tara:strand:- start:873 stop:2387 length:1515 start_codon:yes stop_codon:yes gene_type:complete
MSRIWNWLWPVRWLGVLVVLLWVGVLYQLLHPSDGLSQEKFEQLYPWAVETKPTLGANWMGLYLKKRKIGYVHTTTSKDKEGYVIQQRTLMAMRLFGTQQQVAVFSKVSVNKSFGLRHFTFQLHSALSQFSARGRVHGPYIQVVLNTGGSKRRFQRKYRPSLYSSVLRPYIASLKPKPGKKIRTTIFDPQSMSYVPTVVEVVGYEPLKIHGKHYPKVLKLRQYFRGIKMLSWLDEKGDTLKEVSASGMILLREGAHRARRGISKGVDMIKATRIKLRGRIQAPKTRKSLHVRLRNVDVSSFPELFRRRQSRKAALLLIQKEDVGKLPDVAFSAFASSRGRAKLSQEILDAHKATSLVQSDHPDILKQATKITTKSKTRREAIDAIARWVHTSLKKKSVIGIPSAIETLKTRVGDCNEHATLFAALARAVSIPCQIVSGIAYLRGNFYYHAWNECHIAGEQWLSVDATWGQTPADVTHIVFVRGGLEKQISLIQLMGRLKIDIDL